MHQLYKSIVQIRVITKTKECYLVLSELKNVCNAELNYAFLIIFLKQSTNDEILFRPRNPKMQ